MGNPEFSNPPPTPFSKSVMEEFTAWWNSVEFSNDDETIATLREIMSESTLRLHDLVEQKRERFSEE